MDCWRDVPGNPIFSDTEQDVPGNLLPELVSAICGPALSFVSSYTVCLLGHKPKKLFDMVGSETLARGPVPLPHGWNSDSFGI